MRSVEDALRDLLANQADLAAAYLFGSVARGSEHAGSDVDVAVLFRAAPTPTYRDLPLDLEDELERAVGRKVEVVRLNDAPVDLVHRVLRDGVLIAEHDRAARVAFEVKARNEYFDLQPILALYRRARKAA